VSAATATYTPQPGTIPHRVIAWLRRQPVGEEFAGPVIADKLDLAESGGLVACMAAAVRAGLVTSRKRPGERMLYWSLGDGKALPKPAEDEPDEPLSKAPTTLPDPSKWRLPFSPTATPSAAPQLEPELRAKRKAKAPRPDLAGYVAAIDERHPPDQAADEQGMRIALWSNGVLEVRRSTVGGAVELVLFSADETRQLLHYLECVALPGADA
jgi:hypothetical protein